MRKKMYTAVCQAKIFKHEGSPKQSHWPLYQTTNKRDLTMLNIFAYNFFAIVKSSYRSNKPQRFLVEVKKTLWWCNSEVRMPYMQSFLSHSPICTRALSSTADRRDVWISRLKQGRASRSKNLKLSAAHSILVDIDLVKYFW